MSVHQVEEYYVHIKIKPEHVIGLVEFVGDYEYNHHDHRFEEVNTENPCLTIDDFDSHMSADDCECQILNFIESMEE